MSFFQGIKFFERNIAIMPFGGGVWATSAAEDAEDSFNGNFDIGWQSSGQDSDTSNAYVLRTFDDAVNADTIFVANHNIKNIEAKINDEITIVPDSTVIYGDKAYSVFSIPAAYRETIIQLAVGQAQTILPNSEKEIGEILLLKTMGQFKQPQEIETKRPRQLADLLLQNGKSFIFCGSSSTTLKLNIFSLDQGDIDLFHTIQDYSGEFYIWPCGGNEEQFVYKFSPYRFKDLIKVAVAGGNNPELKNNLYWAGLRDSINLKEVE